MSKKLFKRLIVKTNQPAPEEQDRWKLFRVVIVTLLLLILGLMISDKLPPKTVQPSDQPIIVEQA